MSAIAAGPRVRVAERSDLLDRVVAALPILTLFFWLCLIYCWQSWGHTTPWLFTDELETAQLSRSIAATGHAARRGTPHGFDTLFNYMLAPAWWLSDAHQVYATLKYIAAITMSLTVFPAYWLARSVVSKPFALGAAAAACAVPAFMYSSFMVEEPLAYPYATLCFFVIARALAVRRRRWVVGAVAAVLIAPLVRHQLAIMPIVFLLAAAFRAWGSERMQAWRKDWSTGDWVGAFGLILGAVVLANALLSRQDQAWLITTEFWRHRMIVYGLWAPGSLAIGIGIFPAVAGLAALFRPRGLRASEAERAFVCMTTAAIVMFGFYAAIKAAYLSTVFSTLVEERNLIYLAPLLMISTALLLERGRARFFAVAGSAAFVLYLILHTPYQMHLRLYSDAPGLAILQGANRNFAWTPGYAQNVLIGMLVVSVTLIALLRYLRFDRRAVTAFAAVVGVGVIAWNVTGEVTAARASNAFSNLILTGIAKPYDWLDKMDHGRPAVYLGHGITDPTGIQEMEFWNKSLHAVWSIDGSAGIAGPGPTLTPDLAQTSGRLKGRLDPSIRYIVVDEGVNPVGTYVGRHEHLVGGSPAYWRVYRIERPLRLQNSVTGVDATGWQGAWSFYNQYATPGNQKGGAFVTLSRLGWGGTNVPGLVTVKLGKLVIGPDHQPKLGKVLFSRNWVARSHGYTQIFIPTPKPPWRIVTRVVPTFIPHDLDPRVGDVTPKGVQVGYEFVPDKPVAPQP